MLDSKFFDIMKSSDNYGQYNVGDYLVSVFNEKSSASFHHIVGVTENQYVLQYVGYYHSSCHGNIQVYNDDVLTYENKKIIHTNFCDGYCISPDTFNLILLNYA